MALILRKRSVTTGETLHRSPSLLKRTMGDQQKSHTPEVLDDGVA